MFPTVEINEEELSTGTSEKTLGKVFLFDFNTKRHVLRDGKPVETTYEEAIKQWLTMLLITEVNKFKVYKDSGFGVEFLQFIGRRDLPVGVIVSEVKRQLEEKALQHPEIEGLSDFEIVRENNVAVISFNVQTRRGIITGVTSEVKYSNG